MKTEAIRKIDEIGRIVLPKEMRNELGWHSESDITVTQQGDCLILRSSQNSCFACGKTVNIVPIHNKFICQTCIDKLK